MTGERRERELGDLVEIFDGPHATPAKTKKGPVFLGISNLAEGRLDLREVEHLSEDDYIRWTRRVQPQQGDVVFSYETRLGEAAQIPPNLRCCLGRRMGLLRARKDSIDPRFLLYAYLGPEFQETLRSRTIHGSTVDRLPLIDMPRFPIVVPIDLNEQRVIAHALGTLDDKIEVNRRTSETLEAMARAIFKSWFVDFDPVRAKANGEAPESIYRRLGLTPDLLALFPDRFVDSELGEIPEGWSFRPAGSIYDITIGKTPPRKEARWFSTSPVDVPWMSIKDLGGAGVFIANTSEYLTREAVERFRIRRIPDGTIVLSFKLTVGRVSITDGEMLSNEAIAHFLPQGGTPLPTEFLYCYLRQFDYERLGSTSSIATAVNSDSVRSMPVLVPSGLLPDRFGAAVRPAFERIKTGQREIQTLSRIRDTLLPKLLSGELRVPLESAV